MYIMKFVAVFIFVICFSVNNKIKADEAFSPHTIGHIVGGLGSIFLGPLPGLGLSILPEAISMMDGQSESHDKIVFQVNEYSKEFEVQPYIEDTEEKLITKRINTVKLTNSLSYY